MKIYHHLDALPRFLNSVITIGTFDGVHKGHQQIISRLITEAQAINGESVIITFHPHPRKVVPGKNPIKILTTKEEKIALLEKYAINHLVIVSFTEAFSEQPAEKYIKNFLMENFQPHTIIIGYDHRFGKDRLGDYKLLEKYGETFGFTVKEIPEQIINDITISSTKIREALLCGDVATANKYLGYRYSFEGLVVEGNKLGRELGFPTANIQIENNEKLIPGNGIYAVYISLTEVQQNQPLKGMMSIGIRPTIGGTNRTIEVNIFDFNGNIYGQKIIVNIAAYLRPEVKFNNLEELISAMQKDKLHTLKLL